MVFSNNAKEDAPTRRYLKQRSLVLIQRQPSDQATTNSTGMNHGEPKEISSDTSAI